MNLPETLRCPHFVPFVNGADHLRRALESIPQDEHERVILVDNRDNFTLEPDPRDVSPFRVKCWKPEIALNQAQMLTKLTLLCEAAGWKFFTWMHHDCRLIAHNLRHLYQLAEVENDRADPWGMIFTLDPSKNQGAWNHVDVLCAVNVDALISIGGWDWTRFPDVFSDYDAYGKLAKAGYRMIQSGLPIEHMDGGSLTERTDGNRGLVKKLSWPVYQQLWEARRNELGLQWPPT